MKNEEFDPNERSAWGFASYNIDDGKGEPSNFYTRHENDATVNRFINIGAGGQDHFCWCDDEYNEYEGPSEVRRGTSDYSDDT